MFKLAILVHTNPSFHNFFIVGITNTSAGAEKCTALLVPGEENPSELGINLRLFDRAIVH